MLTAIICSRQDKAPVSLKLLESYLRDNSIDYYIAYDHPNPFSGYTAGIAALGLRDDDDQIILCHDDIEILSAPETLKFWVDKYLTTKNVGFVGVAGSTVLASDCMWWEITRRKEGMHRGMVFQGASQLKMYPNFFGAFGERCCVLDGCFLACTLGTLKKYGMSMPDYLTGFDFYDIHMTATAFFDGKDHYVAPVLIRHESDGQMRDTWFKSKDAFLKKHRQNIPFGCR